MIDRQMRSGLRSDCRASRRRRRAGLGRLLLTLGSVTGLIACDRVGQRGDAASTQPATTRSTTTLLSALEPTTQRSILPPALPPDMELMGDMPPDLGFDRPLPHVPGCLCGREPAVAAPAP